MTRALALAFALVAVACSDSRANSGVDIAVRLRAVPGLSVRELERPRPEVRYFVLGFDQQADLERPDGPRFTRRMTLQHRADDAPMVLYHTGYMLYGGSRLTEAASLVAANQLIVEHRFFGTSQPAPADYGLLTIRQAAEDDHRLITALKAVYRGRWISAGASKGGMTALFHRRLYPDDVDGTVAYVAPINVAADLVTSAENRFARFLDSVGTLDCRQKLRALQREILARRAELVPMMESFAWAEEMTYESVLGAERAFEFALGELPFFFWQYGSPGDCASIPADGSAASLLFEFFAVHGRVLEFTDEDVTAFAAYYHQSATELGWASLDESHVADLLRYPMQDRPRTYLPATLAVADYQPARMEDVLRWARSEASRVLLIYGVNDPWTAAAVDLGATADARDSHRFFVASGNHNTGILALGSSDRDAALAALRRWASVPSGVAALRAEELDTGELLTPRDLRRRTARDLRARISAWKERRIGGQR